MISVLNSCRNIERRYEKSEELIRKFEFELLLISLSMLKKSNEFAKQTNVILEVFQESRMIQILKIL